jgi:hypothetical protein
MPPRERRSYKYIGVGGPYRRQFMGDPQDFSFHPVTRLGGCTLHWKAAWEPVADGANLAAFTDFSQSGTFTVSSDPAMDIDACNGRAAVVFDTTDYAYHSVNQTAPRTVIALAKAGATKSRVISTKNGNWLLGWWGTYMNEFYFEGWVYNPSTACDTNWHLAYGEMSGALSSVYWDTNLSASNASGVGAPNQIEFNGDLAGSEMSDCAIAEVMAFSRVLLSWEREMLFEYFNSYYRLQL